MLKSMLLALDDTPSAIAARSYAMSLAARTGSTLTGIAVVDPDIVAPPESTGMAGDTFKVHKDAVLRQRALDGATALAAQFRDDCRARSVAGDASIVEGNALGSLTQAADVHDVIVAGIDTAFDENQATGVSALVERLLSENPRPVILCPADLREGSRTIMAYDGSVPAMRAMQLFCCLAFRKDEQVLVATIQETESQAATLAGRGAEFMRVHGYDARPLPIGSQGDIADQLVKAGHDHEAGMIVSGAYGHTGWRQWLLGSTTRRLIRKTTLPLFIHH